jgi:ceramide glucosyltransferase
MYLFYFFAIIAIWLGIQSLRRGFRYRAYVQQETARPLADFTPFVSIIAPCRGLETMLHENIEALFAQEYPAYEIVFVTDRKEDPALAVIETLREAWGNKAGPDDRIVVAGEAKDCGQKVHNMRIATTQINAKCEVLAFVDSDARPDTRWLRQLVAPLVDENLGAVTGYRWFVPQRGGLASHLRSVWNASVASALGDNREKNFCWGGSTAIRRSTFDRLDIAERWQGSVSDDFTLTRTLHEARLPIHFTPNCLVPSIGDCDLRELLEFTTRQLKITRVYAPHLWKAVLLGSLLFSSIFFGGIFLVLVRAALGLSFIIPLVLLGIIFVLGAGKAFVRWQAVTIPLSKCRKELNKDLMAQMALWPLGTLLHLFNAIAAAFSRRIHWRGITYELKSPTEAVIIWRN